MNATEFITRDELGLTKAQVECVSKLADICGINPMFEGLFGNAGAVVGGKTKKQADAEKKLAEPEPDPEPVMGTAPQDDADPEVRPVDDIINRENHARSFQSDEDYDAGDNDNVLKDDDAYANEAGEKEAKAYDTVPTARVVGELVVDIAKTFNQYQLIDIGSYMSDEAKAREYIDAYISNMAGNLRRGSDPNFAVWLTGDQDIAADQSAKTEIMAGLDKLARDLRLYREYISKEKDTSPATIEGIEVVTGAIDAYRKGGSQGVSQFLSSNSGFVVNRNTEDAISKLLGTSAKSSDRMKMLKQAALAKYRASHGGVRA